MNNNTLFHQATARYPIQNIGTPLTLPPTPLQLPAGFPSYYPDQQIQSPLELQTQAQVMAQQINPQINLTSPLPSSSSLFLPPRLVILKQNSLAEETFVRNGQTSVVKVVVKNSPFLVQLGLGAVCAPSSEPPGLIFNNPLDLHQLTFDAKLFYDTDDNDEKEVDFVKLKPLEYKIQVHENGVQVNIETRIKVLTSQLEDMFFKVKYRALDPRTKREISPLLCAYSQPIKVVSKPEQLKKKKSKQPKKTSVNDKMVETLARIERQQQNQQNLLAQIQGQPVGQSPSDIQQLYSFPSSKSELSPREDDSPHSSSPGSDSSSSIPRMLHSPARKVEASTTTTTSSSYSSLSESGKRTLSSLENRGGEKRARTEKKEVKMDIETAFSQLMAAWSSVTPEERLEKVRKGIKEVGMTREAIHELHDLCWVEGLHRALGDESQFHSTFEPASTVPVVEETVCSCSDCPHKAELARVEHFYKEIFSLQP